MSRSKLLSSPYPPISSVPRTPGRWCAAAVSLLTHVAGCKLRTNNNDNRCWWALLPPLSSPSFFTLASPTPNQWSQANIRTWAEYEKTETPLLHPNFLLISNFYLLFKIKGKIDSKTIFCHMAVIWVSHGWHIIKKPMAWFFWKAVENSEVLFDKNIV